MSHSQSAEPIVAKPMDPPKRAKTKGQSHGGTSISSTSIPQRKKRGADDDEEDKGDTRRRKIPSTIISSSTPTPTPGKCCVEYCDRQEVKGRHFRQLKGSWPLKLACLYKSQTEILSCSPCYQFQNDKTGHSKKLPPSAQHVLEKQVHIGFLADQIYMEEVVCSCSDCPRNRTPVLVSRFSTEAACPFHTVTIRTRSGDIDFFTPCSSYKAQPKHYNTVVPGTNNPRLFVCHDCGPRFAYFAGQLDADVSNLITVTEHDSTEGTVTVTAPSTVVSPGLAASIKQRLQDLLLGPKSHRCSGITNEYALQYCMDQLLQSMAQGDGTVVPKALLIRTPDGSSVLFSEECSGRRTARSDRCPSCQTMWNDDLRFKALKLKKKVGMTVVHPKTNLSVLTTDQLRAAIQQRTNKLEQSKFNEQKLKNRIKQLETKFVEAPATLKLTATRLEMVIDQAVKNGVINPDSPMYMLLLQSCKNLRKKDSGRSEGNRFPVPIMTLASWLGSACGERGYRAAAELIPGLPSWNTIAYFRNKFASPDDSTEINKEMIKRIFTFLKEKKGRMVAGLHFDEMSCMQGLVVCQRTGRTVGFEEDIDMDQLNKDYEEMCKPAELLQLTTQEMQKCPPLTFETSESEIPIEIESEVLHQGKGDDNVDDFCLASRDQLVKLNVTYFLSSIEGDFSAPVANFAVYSMNNAKVGQHIEFVTKSLDMLATEVNFDLDIQYLVCDGATYSDAYFRTVSSNGYEMPYPGKEGYKVLSILSDPPHLAKKLRNPLVDDNPKRNLTLIAVVNEVKSKTLWKASADENLSDVFATPEEEALFYQDNVRQQRRGGEPLEDPMATYNPSYHILPEELADEQKRYGLKVFQDEPIKRTTVEMPFHSLFYLSTISSIESTVLRPKHINLTPRTKMNVKKAVQVLSTEVADEATRIFIKAVWTDKLNNVPGSEHPFPNPFPLYQYIKHAENFFSVMNATTLDKAIHRLHFRNGRYVDIPLWWHKLLACYLFFKNWEKSLVENNMDIGKCFIPKPTMRHLDRTAHAMIQLSTRVQRKYPDIVICPRSCNQDDVENYFSLVRERWASRNPTVAQIQQTTPALSMLYQMRVQFGEEKQMGSYSKAVKVFGIPVPTGALMVGPTTASAPKMDDIEESESSVLKNFTIPAAGVSVSRKEQYHFKRHLVTALNYAKNFLPATSCLTQDDLKFLQAIESPSCFEVVLSRFSILGIHLRQNYFNPQTYKAVNMRRVVDQHLHSSTFQQVFWSTDFLAQLNCETLPLPPYQEKLMQKFFHRVHAHYIWEDHLNPGREANLRTRLVPGQALDSRTRRLGTSEDECYRCNRIGHWARHCNLPPDKAHLQNLECHRCGALGHMKNNCPHTLDTSKPYKTYPPGVTLSQVIDRLPAIGVQDCESFKPFATERAIGIQQLTPDWFSIRNTQGNITGSRAYITLQEVTDKKGLPRKQSYAHRLTYYEHHMGFSGKIAELDQSMRPAARAGSLDPDLALDWGSWHERSAVCTLLQNVETLKDKLSPQFPNLDTAQEIFEEVGLIQIQNTCIYSSPDGLLTFIHGKDEIRMAVEIKSSFQNGRGRPAKALPYRHYVQVCLEMAALDADQALYVSWSPVGSTVFIVNRSKEFETELFEYLTRFSEDASKMIGGQDSKTSLALHDRNTGNKSAELCKWAKELANDVKPKLSLSSSVDKQAAVATQKIIDEVDSFYKSR